MGWLTRVPYMDGDNGSHQRDHDCPSQVSSLLGQYADYAHFLYAEAVAPRWTGRAILLGRIGRTLMGGIAAIVAVVDQLDRTNVALESIAGELSAIASVLHTNGRPSSPDNTEADDDDDEILGAYHSDGPVF